MPRMVSSEPAEAPGTTKAEDAVNAEPNVARDDTEACSEWTEVVHPEYQRTFWYHRTSRKSTWTPPPGGVWSCKDGLSQGEDQAMVDPEKDARSGKTPDSAPKSSGLTSRGLRKRYASSRGKLTSSASSRSVASSQSTSASLSSSSSKSVGSEKQNGVLGDREKDNNPLWEEHFNKHFNRPYWYNRRERRSTWTPPETQALLRELQQTSVEGNSGEDTTTEQASTEQESEAPVALSIEAKQNEPPIVHTYSEHEHGSMRKSSKKALASGSDFTVGSHIRLEGITGPLEVLDGMNGVVAGFISSKHSAGPFVLNVAGKLLVAPMHVLKESLPSAPALTINSTEMQKTSSKGGPRTVSSQQRLHESKMNEAKGVDSRITEPQESPTSVADTPFAQPTQQVSEQVSKGADNAQVTRRPNPFVNANQLQAELKERALKRVSSSSSSSTPDAPVVVESKSSQSSIPPMISADMLASVKLKRSTLRKSASMPASRPSSSGGGGLLEALKNNVMFRTSQSRFDVNNPADKHGGSSDDDEDNRSVMSVQHFD
mmetsp:Transcript_17127/g.33545  ORF Transcript_17127/g.33545 Transcript_17127/m.33545 type:complete len:544 (+) Transcript_17127:260-1891(+)|eukprot:CAMPEP_0171520464 /NCGR_PEP_ID=MMETSP0959-20130129/6525_1 /TAXON_ID=87120 /ORGANISM="Aurantiochytrium limacinum, Strain ATCCMYA-1381" /LENGTH=543 /DNA_ID=CAMNT_0012060125 /DNA_START=186 /DNA_END=1817 /DNA_ORIENTATION=-